MKRFFFIWLFIPFISYCQNDNEFRLQSVSQDDWDNFCISKMDCFSIENTIDDFDEIGMFYYILYYSYGKSKNKQAVDSVDDTSLLYGNLLYSFNSQKDNSHIVLWKIDGEHVPLFYLYYIKNGKLIKIGEWLITEPCDTCDGLDYSISDIRIFHKNDKIEFLFLKETSFGIYKELSKSLDFDDWGTFKAGELVVSFNIVDGTVRRVEKSR